MGLDIVVQKYGGSSVADLPRLERVAERVVRTAREGKRVCVVVSAMGKTTDELIALARQITEAPPRRELDMLLSTGERIAMALLAMAIAGPAGSRAQLAAARASPTTPHHGLNAALPETGRLERAVLPAPRGSVRAWLSGLGPGALGTVGTRGQPEVADVDHV